MHTTDSPNPARTALVLGLTGGYGRAMAAELARRGWRVRALARDVDRARATAMALGIEADVRTGNVLDREAMDQAADGAAVIVHGVNVPYPRWEAEVVPIARAIAEAAARHRATLLFPGNVYAYAPGTTIGAATPVDPPTRKGELRVEVERTLRDATTRGARLVILRAGDFFGLGHASSWMGQVLAKVPKGGPIRMPQPDDVRHAWCYLPDLARAHVDLLERGDALPPVADLPFEGHVVTGRELTAAIREALGDPARPVRGMPWWMLRLAAPFAPMLREILAMRYLWDREVLLAPRPLEEVLGPVHRTPLVDALREELRRQRAPVAAPTPTARREPAATPA